MNKIGEGRNIENEVKTRPCTADEFDLGDSEEDDEEEDKEWYLLVLPNRLERNRAKTFIAEQFPKLRCYDDEILFETESQREQDIKLRVMFESCHERWYTGGTCKTDAEINEWIKDKSLVTVTNEENFLNDVYPDPVQKHAKLKFY